MKNLKFNLPNGILIGVWISFLFSIFISCQPSNIEPTQTSDSEIDTMEAPKLLPAFDTIDEMLGLSQVHFGDLDSIIDRRIIRVLVPYSHTFYHIDGKERSGLSFHLVNAFEEYLNKKLGFHPPKVRVIFTPVSRQHIVPLLQLGHGDIGVGGLTLNMERGKVVDFSEPFISGLKEIVIAAPNAPKLSSLKDLAGKDVFVHENSDYYFTLQKLSANLVSEGLAPINIKLADPYLDSEDILEMVNSGAVPYTIMIAEMAEHWAALLNSFIAYPDLVLRDNVDIGWVFREESPELKKSIDSFVKHHKKGSLQGNMLYNRFIRNQGQRLTFDSKQSQQRLQKTEAIFKKYATQYQLDWLLMVAQGYQESQLVHKKRSHAGAVGIMQIKPSTAAGNPINIHNVYDIDNNIHASAKYSRYIIDHYFKTEKMDAFNKELFALASYNAGPARIAKLRKRAAEKGLDPNVWFNNVEIMAARSIGRETVQYVSNIYKYYCSFRELKHYGEMSGKPIIP